MRTAFVAKRPIGCLLVAVLSMLSATGASAQTTAPAPAQQYQAALDEADRLLAAGDPFEAVRKYEQAGRIAYNNKLPTDQAAFAAKLAAARAARDTKASATARPAAPVAAPTPAPATPAVAATSTKPTATTTASTSEADNPEAWVRYADALVTATDYKEAIRAYERAKRLATNQRVAIDTAAVDAKRANAIQLRDAPKAKTADVVPEPPPPLPPEPGTKETQWLEGRPGKIAPWQIHAEGFVMRDAKVMPADLTAFDANLHKIMDVLAKAPVLNPPMGFELESDAALGAQAYDQPELKNLGSARLPLQSEIRFSGSSYFARGNGVDKAVEASCRTGIEVNTLPSFAALSFKPDPSLDETFFVEPTRDGELGGVPVFGGTLVIVRPGVPLWLPVSNEQALAVLLPKYKASADSMRSYIVERQKKYTEYMSPAEQEKRRREVATERDTGHEANAKKLEVMQRRWEDDARKESESAASDPKLRADIDRYDRVQAFTARLDAAGRAAPACVIAKPTTAASAWELVATGTAGCRPLVRTNPQLLDARLPRTGLQVISLSRVTLPAEWFADDRGRGLRNEPGDCVALAKILRQTDWSALRALIAQ